MPRPINDSIIVITGASSGIGRATALELAKQGATLLLAARREAALQEVAAECNRLGGQAIAVPTNVTNEEAVQALARRAVDTFGRLDVWVNNAAVTLLHDPNQDRLTIKGMTDFRVKRLCLGEAYESFLEKSLPPDGVDAVGLPTIERWREVFKKARKRGEFIGVEEDKFPRNFATLIRYYTDFQRIIPSRYPLPGYLTLEQLDQFIKENNSAAATRRNAKKQYFIYFSLFIF
ncbi:SDR family NAD(P)-dependent oxidoreductase [Mastigocladopsis repens]|uniref:SDR family NAD(P)-dependent oxidoreductase n=1 Tax=Mastigocladopsis repens TaxID=221287 RepID=UPI0002EB7781|nr:SDR family NAD(P)-dependent oxidoreductase [Mastigocladopsis repens]